MTTAKKTSSKRKKATPKPAPARAATRLGAPVEPVEPSKTVKPVKPGKSAKSPKPPKAVKPAKPVRDSFRMPAPEYDLLRALKTRAKSLGVPARKSEILRAGLRTLQRMDDEQYAVLLASVQSST